MEDLVFDVWLDDDIYQGYLDYVKSRVDTASVASAAGVAGVDDIDHVETKDKFETFLKSVDDSIKQVECFPPIQLPLLIYTKYKHQFFRAVIYMMDDEKGNHGVTGKNKRNKAFIRLIEVPPSHAHLLNKVYSAPSNATGEFQRNSENGWNAWKDEINHRPIGIYRECKQGRGFINPTGATVHHRDYLMSMCDDCKDSVNKTRKFITSDSDMKTMRKKLTTENLFNFLEQSLPNTLVPMVKDIYV
jgi:hypothetical protein